MGTARWALPWGKVSFARMEGGFCQVGTARWTQPEKKVGSARQAKVSSARWALLGWKVGFAMGKAGHCQVSSVLGSPVPQGRPGHSVLLSLSPRDPWHGPGPFLPALGWLDLKPGVFGVCSLAWLLFGGCWSWGLQQVKDRTSAGCRDRVGTGGELLWSPALPCLPQRRRRNHQDQLGPGDRRKEKQKPSHLAVQSAQISCFSFPNQPY